MSFTPFHRGGSGPPLLLLHGFSDTWRTWELVIPALERRHEVVALTLPGHAGGPPIPEPVSAKSMIDQLEVSLDEQGLGQVDIVGNSLGGYAALKLAERGRARSLVALAPAGGFATAEEAAVPLEMLGRVVASSALAAPYADRIYATDKGRRQGTQLLTTNYEHIPAELLIHQLLALAAFKQSDALIAAALRDGWPLDPQRITCPLRIIWGTADQVLAWPAAAARFQHDFDAEWVVLDGIGHCPQLDVPAETAALILEFTGR